MGPNLRPQIQAKPQYPKLSPRVDSHDGSLSSTRPRKKKTKTKAPTKSPKFLPKELPEMSEAIDAYMTSSLGNRSGSSPQPRSLAPSRNVNKRPTSKAHVNKKEGAENSKSKPLYRIGDGLKFFHNAPGCNHYPDSIVCAYQRRTRKPNSIPDLLKVLEARNQSDVPPPEVAVAHVRLGDGLCAEVDWRCRRTSRGPSDCWNDIHDCFSLLEPPYPWFAYPKEYYAKVVQELNVNRLVIMTSTKHWPDPRAKRNGTSADERYISQLMAFLKSRGLNVELRLNKDPDEDFTYACAARIFVKGGGGFSKLISQVVQARGGAVLPTKMDQSLLVDKRPRSKRLGV